MNERMRTSSSSLRFDKLSDFGILRTLAGLPISPSSLCARFMLQSAVLVSSAGDTAMSMTQAIASLIVIAAVCASSRDLASH